MKKKQYQEHSDTSIAIVNSSGVVTGGLALKSVPISATASDGIGIVGAKQITVESGVLFSVTSGRSISGSNLVFSYSSTGYICGSIYVPIPSSTLTSSYELSGLTYTSGCSSKSFV